MSPDRVYAYVGSDILLRSPGNPALEPGAIAALPLRARRVFPLGEGFAEAVLVEAPSGAAASWVPEGFLRLPVRGILGELAGSEAAPLLKGLALMNWLDTARFCGRCGAPLADIPAGDGDAGGRRCGSCGLLVFPRISPAVIVLVKKEGRALLAHNLRFPSGRFGLIAGFVEAGESVEDCLRRELREEAGIEVRDVRYRRSQPWPFPDSLMLAFTAEWASGEARPDGGEIGELRWCSPDELPEIPPPGSVARRLIDEYLLGVRR